MKFNDAQLSITQGETGLYVTGLRETIRALERSGAATADIKETMRTIANVVAGPARQMVPIGKTGKLLSSIRVGAAKTKATVRAGSARVPYAGIIHYGWPERKIRARPFLDDARASRLTEIQSALIDGLGKILDSYQLDNNL
ncbi:Bacteriophage protein of uncharacterised function (DUF646) [Actinobaculum suis]|uniref:Bacteriophage protein of uncharacterized function (DUF646) n=1 Tax=Actinobaculum suis TaxID=1657 RepID=A0A7Z8Y9P5_9ACTO|nr:HK97 gp10 family phage protein [Actinobaculum suis]VDG76911.1 Bacteriophage protein of uncharacterised function (DUF646) [Actinobaculum suis]